ncbi:TPA: hypothetical protein ACM35X_005085, partial [Escherichia coli]
RGETRSGSMRSTTARFSGSAGKRPLSIHLSKKLFQFASDMFLRLLSCLVFTGTGYSVIGVTFSVPVATA